MKRSYIIMFLLLSLRCLGQDGQKTNSFGLLPPTLEELKKTPYSSSFNLPSGFVLPKSIDLSVNMPPASDQGCQGSCVAWALAYGLKSYEEKIKHNWDYYTSDRRTDSTKMFSPSFLFNTVKFNRIPRSRDCKSGITFYEGFNILLERGVATLAEFPYNKGKCNDCLDANPLSDDKLMEKAGNNKIGSFQRLLFNDPDELKYYLSLGIPVAIGVMLDRSFEDDGWAAGRNGKKFIWNPDTGSANIGYQAMVCLGYDDNLKEFKVLNSWGQKWGTNGMMYVPYNKFFSPDANISVIREAYIVFDAISPKLLATNLKLSASNNSSDTANQISSSFQYGYYREYHGIRVGLIYLGSTEDEVLVQFTDIANANLIQSITYKTGESKSFFFGKNKVTFSFNKIDRAGKNVSKSMAYFNIKFEETSSDPNIKKVMDQFQKDRENVRNNLKNLRQQQQQLQQLEQQLQLREQQEPEKRPK